eukprot:6756710-Prymnesium_polylepis.1
MSTESETGEACAAPNHWRRRTCRGARSRIAKSRGVSPCRPIRHARTHAAWRAAKANSQLHFPSPTPIFSEFPSATSASTDLVNPPSTFTSSILHPRRSCDACSRAAPASAPPPRPPPRAA